MDPQCTQQSFKFQALGRRCVQADFSGGRLTSDAGGVLLREVEKRLGIIEELAECFEDARDSRRVEHRVEELLAWCESKRVDYIFGLSRNERLQKQIGQQKERAKAQFEKTGRACRIFVEFEYQTRTSWSRARRVIAKVEHLPKGGNPRFVVTSLKQGRAKRLYEKTYCTRGDMENRIKEQQLDLFADRTSTSHMRSNQLRLWFSTAAYLLLHQLRRLGLKGTVMARAQCGTIRLKLLKIGAQIRISVRRVMLALAGGYPYQRLFTQVYQNLRAQPLLS